MLPNQAWLPRYIAHSLGGGSVPVPILSVVHAPSAVTARQHLTDLLEFRDVVLSIHCLSQCCDRICLSMLHCTQCLEEAGTTC
jgi:hypothetical protein